LAVNFIAGSAGSAAGAAFSSATGAWRNVGNRLAAKWIVVEQRSR
jgi:hypothetical protein